LAPRLPGTARSRAGFTIIEIMVVVAIMGVMMLMSAPVVYRVFKKEPMNKAVRDILEVCSNARAQAILDGKVTELWIYPKDKRFSIAGAGPATPSPEEEFLDPEEKKARAASDKSGLVAQLSDRVEFEMVDVNLTEYKDQELAKVRFNPNGTCDEMTVVLRSDRGEWLKISLEVTTSLANVGPVNQ
jgi:prepilin-type N-terminal cleavage/methylation domain-containing protein